MKLDGIEDCFREPFKKFRLVADHDMHDEDVVFSIAEIADGVQVFEHGQDRLLVIEDGIFIDWCLLEHAGSWAPTLGSETDPANWRFAIYAWGAGPCGSLREPRHTYFGKDGYIFYVRPSLLTWGFSILAKWFDYDE